MRSNNSGFTLLEIIIALTILGISMGVILSSFSTSLKNIRVISEYDLASFLAQSKMEETLSLQEIEEDDEVGYFEEFPNFSWERVIEEMELPEDEGQPYPEEYAERENFIKMYKITVIVSWKRGENKKSYKLTTVKTVVPFQREMLRTAF